MNEQERKVIKLELNREETVIAALERQYRNALRDIDDKIRILQSDDLTQSRVYQIQYQKALRGQVAGILDKLHGDQYATIQQYLHDSYQDGFIGTMYSLHGQGIPLIVPLDQDAAVKAIMTDSKINEGLYASLGVDTKQLKKAISSEISRGIASNLPFADIARNIKNRTRAPLGRAKTIVRTESHRIQQAAANDARDAAKARGCDVVKQWDGTLDGDTRPTHRRLDGQIRETDEPFEMDGKTAMYPGDFGKAEEDCNCRCVALTRAKWALDEEELETLKQRAKTFGLTEKDKKQDFEEFREKYLTASAQPPVSISAEKQLEKQRRKLQELKTRHADVNNAVDRYYWDADERTAHGIGRREQFQWKASVNIDELGKEEYALRLQVQEQEEIVNLLESNAQRSRTINKTKRKVYEIEDFAFGDGTDSGVYKRATAQVYTTPDGVEIIYPKDYDVRNQTLTPEQALKAWKGVPDYVKTRSQSRILVVDYANPQDAYWAKTYKVFSQSYATGGDVITLYKYTVAHDTKILSEKLIHEVGHYIDRLTNGENFSSGTAWTNAMDKDLLSKNRRSPTEYGENSKSEDFAESVMMYATNKTEFQRNYPHRASLLKLILGV